jgi:ribonuclease HI
VTAEKNPEIIIYSDGSSRGNPGPGGYGTVLQSGPHRRELSQGYKMTTNNRMELMAVIVGLEALKVDQCRVTVYTDSKYVADAVEKGWIYNWVRTRFKGKKNEDLWLRFLEVYKRHKVKFIWIRGHTDIAGNERCDQLAVQASLQDNLLEDTGYQPER